MPADIDRIEGHYTVIREHSLGDLLNEVNRFIKSGWKAQGGIAVVSQGAKLEFFQSLTR